MGGSPTTNGSSKFGKRPIFPIMIAFDLLAFKQIPFAVSPLNILSRSVLVQF